MLLTKYKNVSAQSSLGLMSFLLCLISFSAVAQINAEQEVLRSQINQQVKQYLTNQLTQQVSDADPEDVRIGIRQIDKRINVPNCPSGFEISNKEINLAQSNISLKLSCPSSNAYLFVNANVSIVQKVVVAADTLSPGTLLSSSNLRTIEVDKSRLRGSTYKFVEDVQGARVKRRVRTGNIISNNMLCFICKGDRVTIAAVSGGLSVKVYGVAEQDGNLGDTIQVRNISSDKLVFARIASTSQVEISI